MLSKTFTRREQLVLLAIAVAVVVGAVTVILLQPRETEARITPKPVEPARPIETDPEPPAPPEPAPPEPAPERTIAVAIRGAIYDPGVYELPESARVEDLIRKAGGAADSADLSDINLAAQLVGNSTLTLPHGSQREEVDGQLVVRGGERAVDLNPGYYTISRAPNTAAPASPAPNTANATTADTKDSQGRINLNRAGQQELETLPGIGPVRAQAIIEYRQTHPFTHVDELIDVNGIGPVTLEKLRASVFVD